MRNYEVTIRIPAGGRPPGAAGLLLPLPPRTAFQDPAGVEIPCHWRTLAVRALHQPQQALYIDDPRGDEWQVRLRIRSGEKPPVSEHFHVPENRFAQITEDVRELYESLTLDGLDTNSKAGAIAQCLANRFSYSHGYNSEEPVSLSCDALTGNCLDINTGFMKLLAAARIPCAYYIGHFFPADDRKKESADTLVTHDWHCWVSTCSGGQQLDWDIAHHIKRGLTPIQPGLNPVPGRRFALSTGRELTFELPMGPVTVSHLGLPRWIHEDGSTLETLVEARSRPLVNEPTTEEH